MSSNTKTLLVIGILAIGAFLLFRGGSGVQTNSSITASGSSNVTIVGGQQIVTIKAKGGYQPQASVVQAGLPTVIRFVTNGSFDCSSSVRIADLGISQSLPSSGTTDVNVGTLSSGTLQGTCSMGMYKFELDVQG